jgi:hypothetical protein
MTVNLRSKIVVVSVSLMISSLATAVRAEERCTNASLVGSYAFKVDGANIWGPFAAVGKNTYDGKGAMKGSIVISSNGWIVNADYAGAYSVRSDCTGFKSATFEDGPLTGVTVDFDFVIDDDLREIRMIVSDAGFTVSGTARKLSTDGKSKD